MKDVVTVFDRDPGNARAHRRPWHCGTVLRFKYCDTISAPDVAGRQGSLTRTSSEAHYDSGRRETWQLHTAASPDWVDHVPIEAAHEKTHKDTDNFLVVLRSIWVEQRTSPIDKKVVSLLCRFRAPLHLNFKPETNERNKIFCPTDNSQFIRSFDVLVNVWTIGMKCLFNQQIKRSSHYKL
jgi:hypothetical protein